MVVPEDQSLDAPRRSPGFMGMNLGPRTPPIREDGAFSPPIEQPQAQRSYSQGHSGVIAGAGAGGGVQRKKSLMQKIKTMVRQRPSVEGGGGEYVSGPSRSTVVVSGPMAGQQHGLSSPGLSDGGGAQDENPMESSPRREREAGERYEDAQEEMFGMSPEVDKGKLMRQGYGGQI